MSLVVRRATARDAGAISAIRVETWRAAYAGLIAREVLDGLDADREAERRFQHWDENHVEPRAAEFVAERDGEPVGWASAGPSNEVEGEGELYAIYATPSQWSTGVGHALMIEAEKHLRAAGFTRAHLWYLEGNDRAASFYESHGWVEDGQTKTDDRIVGGREAFALHERRRVRDLRRATPRDGA